MSYLSSMPWGSTWERASEAEEHLCLILRLVFRLCSLKHFLLTEPGQNSFV